jgi:hypothetical protein
MGNGREEDGEKEKKTGEEEEKGKKGILKKHLKER